MSKLEEHVENKAHISKTIVLQVTGTLEQLTWESKSHKGIKMCPFLKNTESLLQYSQYLPLVCFHAKDIPSTPSYFISLRLRLGFKQVSSIQDFGSIFCTHLAIYNCMLRSPVTPSSTCDYIGVYDSKGFERCCVDGGWI
jgi:hypothetical protein